MNQKNFLLVNQIPNQFLFCEILSHSGKASLLDEKNRFYQNDVTHYCPINPGIILSRKLLLRLCPHVNTCVEDHSKLNSVSFARCIKRFLGITCLNSPKVFNFLYTS